MGVQCNGAANFVKTFSRLAGRSGSRERAANLVGAGNGRKAVRLLDAKEEGGGLPTAPTSPLWVNSRAGSTGTPQATQAN